MSLDGGYLLAIDASTRCGFAILREDGTVVQSGVVVLAPRKGEGQGARFMKLHEHLDSLLRCFPNITSVAYESPGGHFQSRAAMLAVVGLAMHVESWCERVQLHYREFSPKEVKNAAGCRGDASKADVAIPMARRFARDPATIDDNEADALAVGIAGLVELGCVPPLVLTTDAAPKKRARKTDDEQLVDDFYNEGHV